MTAPADASDQGPRTFSSAVSICFSKYATFGGRAPRSEYWYFALFNLVVMIAAEIVDFASGVAIVSTIAGLVLFLPGLSVHIRRLHDIDRSGWWWWILLIPLVGAIIMLVWVCTRGTTGPNRFGADPLAGEVVPRYAAI
ncbi:MAG: DUF805 domain-containing protein [Alphaproteobacteria bacterium]|nr:DUF805 domain-containing protein [Alphaproteobacteria bacterium]